MFKTPLQSTRITNFAANNRTSAGNRRKRQSLHQIDENDMSFLSHSPTKSSFTGEIKKPKKNVQLNVKCMDQSASTRNPNAAKVASNFEQLMQRRSSVKKLRKENS
jgi:hypothetical protein